MRFLHYSVAVNCVEIAVIILFAIDWSKPDGEKPDTSPDSITHQAGQEPRSEIRKRTDSDKSSPQHGYGGDHISFPLIERMAARRSLPIGDALTLTPRVQYRLGLSNLQSQELTETLRDHLAKVVAYERSIQQTKLDSQGDAMIEIAAFPDKQAEFLSELATNIETIVKSKEKAELLTSILSVSKVFGAGYFNRQLTLGFTDKQSVGGSTTLFPVVRYKDSADDSSQTYSWAPSQSIDGLFSERYSNVIDWEGWGAEFGKTLDSEGDE